MQNQGMENLLTGAGILLLHLAEEDDITLTSLAHKSELENSTLTPLIDDLERNGLVQRVRDTRDRRMIRIRITQQGRSLETPMRAIWHQLHNEAVQNIPQAALETTLETMQRIADNLNNLDELTHEEP